MEERTVPICECGRLAIRWLDDADLCHEDHHSATFPTMVPASRVAELEEERQAVIDAVNLYGDETLHKALDDIGFAVSSPPETGGTSSERTSGPGFPE